MSSLSDLNVQCHHSSGCRSSALRFLYAVIIQYSIICFSLPLEDRKKDYAHDHDYHDQFKIINNNKNTPEPYPRSVLNLSKIVVVLIIMIV